MDGVDDGRLIQPRHEIASAPLQFDRNVAATGLATS